MKIKKISILTLIGILLLSLAACNNQAAEKDKELAEKIDSISVGFSNSEDAEEVFEGLNEEQRGKLMTDLLADVTEYFEKNKDFEIRTTVENVLKKNNIESDKVDNFKIYLFSYQALDSKKYNIKLSNAGPSYAYESDDGDPYFPNTSDEEILESFEKLCEYAMEEAKKGNSVKLTPEIMDKLGIKNYDKEKIEEMKFQYVYYMDLK